MYASSEQLVHDWFSVFNTGDTIRFEQMHSPACRNHAPAPFDLTPWPDGGKPFGPGAAAETVTWLRSNQPDLRVTVESIVSRGEEVVAWIRTRGTPTGPGPIPPTGRTVDFHQAHRFRVCDGRVVEHWAVRDDLRSMLQAGVIAPPTFLSSTDPGAPR